MSLTIVNINCEMHRHLDTILPFLEKTEPDIVCLQEVYEHDVVHFAHATNSTSFFAPNAIYYTEGIAGDAQELGVGYLTNDQTAKAETVDYFRADTPLEFANPTHGYNWRRSLIVVHETRAQVPFHLATTHFTWTPHGDPDDAQRVSQQILMKKLSSYEDVLLVGDLNAPRGGEIYKTFTREYTDHVPQDYTTSIDMNLHRAGDVGLVVDHVLSRGTVPVRSVAYRFGVSDHAAIVIEVD